MAIRYVPNDPLATGAPPVRQQTPRADPPAPRIRFSHAAPAPEGLHAIGTPAFLFWQCRESALAALDVWSQLAPALTRWHNGQRSLPLRPLAGTGLNARYDRNSLSFMQWPSDTRTTFVASSTDAVAHEVGHALLDAIRPELWDSVYVETAAFHEAFADCIALLVGFFDLPTRRTLLQPATRLGNANFLEALTEDVADALRREYGAQHPQAQPRRALNALRWVIPINLPPSGAATALTSQAHSFSRIFTGCFYDCVRNILALAPARTEQALLAAAKTTGRLLIAGARNAPESARFFQAVGRTMIAEDEATNAGRHRLAIRDAFANHNIALGTAAMLAPTAALGGGAPRIGGAGGAASLSMTTRDSIRSRIGAARGSRLRTVARRVGDRVVAQTTHHRTIDLGVVDRRLRNVVALAAESVLVGASAASAVVLDHLPDPVSTVEEAQHFVATLLDRGALRMPEKRRKAAGKRRRPAEAPTHAIRTRAGRKVLTRVCFACRCDCR